MIIKKSAVDPQRLYMWCLGCERIHAISDQWEWDGDTDQPTITPSILVSGVQWQPGESFHQPRHASVMPGNLTVCHSFVRHGRWEFLGDCTHPLVGQTVPMVNIPAGAQGIA
jgi:hypothetical protein